MIGMNLVKLYPEVGWEELELESNRLILLILGAGLSAMAHHLEK